MAPLLSFHLTLTVTQTLTSQAPSQHFHFTVTLTFTSHSSSIPSTTLPVSPDRLHKKPKTRTALGLCCTFISAPRFIFQTLPPNFHQPLFTFTSHASFHTLTRLCPATLHFQHFHQTFTSHSSLSRTTLPFTLSPDSFHPRFTFETLTKSHNLTPSGSFSSVHLTDHSISPPLRDVTFPVAKPTLPSKSTPSTLINSLGAHPALF